MLHPQVHKLQTLPNGFLQVHIYSLFLLEAESPQELDMYFRSKKCVCHQEIYYNQPQIDIAVDPKICAVDQEMCMLLQPIWAQNAQLSLGRDKLWPSARARNHTDRFGSWFEYTTLQIDAETEKI